MKIIENNPTNVRLLTVDTGDGIKRYYRIRRYEWYECVGFNKEIGFRPTNIELLENAYECHQLHEKYRLMETSAVDDLWALALTVVITAILLYVAQDELGLSIMIGVVGIASSIPRILSRRRYQRQMRELRKYITVTQGE